MSHKPTEEQAAIIAAAKTGDDLTIEAGAGTGKTSTLEMLAGEASGRGAYLAYNKAIATDAAKRFPSSVTCKTAHSFAYGAVGRNYAHRLNGPRVPARQAAIILGLNEPVKVGETMLAPQQLARLVTETIQRFCYSDDREVQRMHVPLVNGLDKPGQAKLAKYLMPIAQKAWDNDLTQTTGQLRYTHDCYLKQWILTDPVIHAEYVLLDEAQDSNPAVAGLVSRQPAQRILVGDRAQAIYGWRGATDAMASFDGRRFQLSQSFRFGRAIADEANKWLSLLDNTDLRLTGYERIASRVEPLAAPDAVLCRSNGGAIIRVIEALGQGRRAALVGGGQDIRRMAEAAQKLQAGMPTDHPELFVFTSWREVQEYVEMDAAGSDLRVFVRLIDRHSPREVMRVCNALVDERHADVIVSTAHKAKGREWGRVRIADDFPEPKVNEETGRARIARDEVMLAYVAVTRAQQVLDRSGLSWVDQYATGRRADSTPEESFPIRSMNELIEASSLGTPGAVALRERTRRDLAPNLTGMKEEQADWLDDIGSEYQSDPTERITAVAQVAPEYVRPAPVSPAPELEPVGYVLAPPGGTRYGVLLNDCQRCDTHHAACRCILGPDRWRPWVTAGAR